MLKPYVKPRIIRPFITKIKDVVGVCIAYIYINSSLSPTRQYLFIMVCYLVCYSFKVCYFFENISAELGTGRVKDRGISLYGTNTSAVA